MYDNQPEGTELLAPGVAVKVTKSENKIYFLRCNYSRKWMFITEVRFRKISDRFNGDIKSIGECFLTPINARRFGCRYLPPLPR